MKIYTLGIDQGIANLGTSLVSDELKKDNPKIEKLMGISTESDIYMAKRIEIIGNVIEEYLKNYDIRLIGCEKLFFNAPSSKGGRNKSASMLYTNMSTGLLYYLSGKYNVPIKEFVPGTIKKNLCGNGRASKEEVIARVHSFTDKEHHEDLSNEHVADSLGIGISAMHEYKKNFQYYDLVKNALSGDGKKFESLIKEYEFNKSEKAKHEKMIQIRPFVNKKPSEISKETGITSQTVKKYVNEIRNEDYFKLYNEREEKLQELIKIREG